MESFANLADYGVQIVKIIGIAFLSPVSIEAIDLAIEEMLAEKEELTEIQNRKRKTLVPLIKNFAKYLVYFGAGIAILYIVNIDPTPILAAAGIVSLAIGFGAQNLINDVVCGLLIIFDQYYLVGEFIEIDGVKGLVEAIELRTTRIRSINGQQYIIRNGEIGRIVNYSKEYLSVVVEVGVAYNSNLDLVYRVIEEVGVQLQELNDNVLQATKVKGLEEFGEYYLLVRTKTKVKPPAYKKVERLLRKMIKEAFDREGIEIPVIQYRLTPFREGDRPDSNFEQN